MKTWPTPPDSCRIELQSRNQALVDLAPLEYLQNKRGWNCVADPRGICQSRLPGSFDEHHVDNAQNVARVRIKQGTTTVSGISSSIELKDIETTSPPQAAYRFFIELLGCRSGQSSRNDGRNHAAVRHG